MPSRERRKSVTGLSWYFSGRNIVVEHDIHDRYRVMTLSVDMKSGRLTFYNMLIMRKIMSF